MLSYHTSILRQAIVVVRGVVDSARVEGAFVFVYSVFTAGSSRTRYGQYSCEQAVLFSYLEVFYG